MKRIIVILLALALSLCILSMTASAAVSPSAGWDGPDVVRAGNTITVTFTITGENVYGMDCMLDYNKSMLTLTEKTVKIGSPWKVDFYDNKIVAMDDSGFNNPLNGKSAIFSLTFKVNSNAVTGEELKISCQNVTLSDGQKEVKLGEISYVKQITRPLSSDYKLKSLTVKNATISPAFSATTYFYSAQVPYDVKKLDVSAVANQSGAKVSINNPNLAPGGTTNVVITVTAENGSTKAYTIAVTRARDPNYTEAGDNTLSNIKVEGFLLSPVFTADNTGYVVWVPYETESVNVTGTTNHSKATVRVLGGRNLFPGMDNKVELTCTAEDGSMLVYTVVVKRAGPHVTEPETTEPVEPEETEPTEPPTEPPVEEPTEEPTQETTQEPTTTPDYSQQDSGKDTGVNIGILVILSILFLLVGMLVGILIGRAIHP